MAARDSMRARAGFAVPLAVVVMIALALLSALGIEAALGALRADTAGTVEVRAAALAETELARALAQGVDTAAIGLAAGAVVFTRADVARDSAVASAQVIEPGLVRLAVTAVVRRAGFRGIAGRMAFATIVADTSRDGSAALVPLPSNWWVDVP